MPTPRNRRNFLYYTTAAVGAVGVVAAVGGLGKAVGPSADQEYQGEVKIDFADLEEGQQITILYQGRPLFLRHRTQLEIDQARATPLDDLIDRHNRYDFYGRMHNGEPATDQSRSIDPEGRYVLFVGICTHLGCVPIGDGAGDFNGWFCPCHSAHFDTSGRTRKGPAPYNLYIPRYEWDGETIITLLDPSRVPPMSDEQLDRLIFG
ncbi:ubiquinol-cytochrome c reductase iron-sulfur subunit [Octadecabacter temperatus]|uniref:Ubiquinol-cytochrome c reductase iron-sulfur subunit n=1 Tax=Octadecabacter temperatus TaxID=1458307 RepID=A0A0K0Y0V2_9RHOB|nr:ubiquinol-cytochrome c reductase iron-sulfur subunit [Octadecabacter temperatus]AKS44578.1 Ubiquinol-cytochrome c reductase iron-sulfur subunit [Octadecabacter temperatus]SIO37902.1 ubiquinol-cytochrome c reductase iron-sulfur subunit [Octadecabacter temperatus]